MPASQTWILAAFLQYSRFDFFSQFAVGMMRSRGEILIGVVYLVAAQPAIDSGLWRVILLTDRDN